MPMIVPETDRLRLFGEVGTDTPYNPRIHENVGVIEVEPGDYVYVINQGIQVVVPIGNSDGEWTVLEKVKVCRYGRDGSYPNVPQSWRE